MNSEKCDRILARRSCSLITTQKQQPMHKIKKRKSRGTNPMQTGIELHLVL
jgi:hypothetical protein